MAVRVWAFSVPVLLSTSLAAAIPARAAERNEIPRDFKIVARYLSGGTTRTSWEATITADGTVSRTHHDAESGRDVRKTFRLSRNDVLDLWRRTGKANFFKLQPRYEGAAEDVDGFAITVTMNMETHEVVVWYPGGQWDNRDVRELWRLWNQILREVPSPNPDQRPGEAPIRVP